MTRKQTNETMTIAESFNADEREQIVFHRDYDPKFYQRGGIARYKDVPFSAIKILAEKGCLNPDEMMDRGATIQDFIDFVEEHDQENWTFHGYVVSPDREDSRVGVEGIESKGKLSKDDLIDFLLEFRMADELDIEKGIAYCWYD